MSQNYDVNVGINADFQSAGRQIIFHGDFVTSLVITNNAPVSVQYSPDAGVTWTTLAPGSTAQPAVPDATTFFMRRMSAGGSPAFVRMSWRARDSLDTTGGMIGNDLISKPLKQIVQGAPISKGKVPYMASPPGLLVLAANAQPSNVSSPQWSYNGGSPAMANYVYHGLPGSASPNAPTTLATRTTVFNFANWTDTGTKSSFNDGKNFEIWTACTPAHSAYGASGNYTPAVVGMMTDAPVIGFIVTGTDQKFYLIVDGELAFPHLVLGGASPCWALVNFGFRKMREIIYVGGDSANFAGIAIDRNDSIAPLDMSKAGMSFAFMMDSYGQQNLTSAGPHSIQGLVTYLMGGRSYVGSIIGGTGYAQFNASLPQFTSPIRIAQLTSANPDVVVVCGGINDAWPTSNGGDTAAAMLSTFQQIRAALPNAIIVATGPWCPAENQVGIAKYVNINAGIKAQLATITGRWIFIDNLNGVWYNSSGATGSDGGTTWQTGSGTVAGTGIGNCYLYLRSDGTHPTNTPSTQLAAAATSGDTTLTVPTTLIAAASSFATAGTLLVGGLTVTYTGKTATTFTGCSGITANIPIYSTVKAIADGADAGGGLDYLAYRIANALQQGILNL